ncbi:MAG: Gldg family protein [Clostridia bacterium]|nr:Gldg family protein [Clostridia bacterium]
MSNSLFKGKSTRTKIFTAITIVAILLLIGLNMLLTFVGDQSQIFIDLTPEGFYSMTDKMVDACAEILDTKDENGNKREIKITFCADPDRLENSSSLRATYFMALQMRNRFDNVTVETVNVDLNPAAVAMYRTTSRREITAADMIVSYNGRYKITDATSFWTDNSFSYNGEYRMVSILASLTALSSPAAYFICDHGELYYDPENPDSEHSLATSEVAELIEERGLQIKTLEISKVDAIPEDCALLIINDPKIDYTPDPDRLDEFYYVSDLEKIDRYLASKSGAVIVNKAYDRKLPVLESFLAEWGIGCGEGLVKDKDNCLPGVGEEGTAIVGVYDKDSFGGAYYGDYAELPSAPKMIFTNSGYLYCTFEPNDTMNESGSFNASKNYSHFITTSEGAIAYNGSETAPGGEDGVKKALAAASVRTYLDGETSETVYSYLFCTNTADFFSNELIGNKSYANRDIMASVISSISRIDRYASMSLGGLSMNSPSYGGKQTQTTTLTEKTENIYSADAKDIIAVNHAFTIVERVIFTVFVAIVPVAVMCWGIVIFIKRKNL